MDENPLIPTPLQYETPSPSRTLCRREHIWNAVALVLFAIVLLVPACGLVPRLEAIFKDFKTELPGITKLLLTFSRWAANGYGWVFVPLLLAALWSLGLALDRIAPTDKPARYYGRWLRRLLFLLGILWLTLVILGSFMPLLQLIDTVSGSRK
jgi:hypothetical protein